MSICNLECIHTCTVLSGCGSQYYIFTHACNSFSMYWSLRLHLSLKSYGQAYNSKISVVSKQKDIYNIYKLCSYITVTISYRIHGFLINNMYYISNSLFHFHSLLRWRRCPTLYYMHVLLLIVIYVLLFILVYTNSWRIVVSGNWWNIMSFRRLTKRPRERFIYL